AEIEQKIMNKLGIGAEAKAQQAKDAKAADDAAAKVAAADAKKAAAGPVLAVEPAPAEFAAAVGE
ncbi:MAG: DNA recombination/repair protein RecA, partial [Rhodoglobus sp.]